MAALMLILGGVWESAFAGKYDASEKWDGKFRYGAYSTLISSHVMGTQFRDLVVLLSEPMGDDPEAQLQEIRLGIDAFREVYENLDDDQVDIIIEYARNNETPSIFEEERSITTTIEQNNAFISNMDNTLMPVDGLIEGDAFKSDNFQFNTHRALYNNAYGIPQNSLAAIVNAYVVGIRSIEFDVLESSDNINVVLHDLVTNRLDGSFAAPPRFADNVPFEELQNTNIDVLIPTGDAPAVERSGISHLTATEQVIRVVGALMPELTLYVDARNDAPVSFIRLLKDYPNYRDNFVLKIYPFTLHGGMTDLVERYADRYHGGNVNDAEAEIGSIRPHVLLALGNAEAESNAAVGQTGTLGFDWAAFQDEARHLPFTRISDRPRDEYDGSPLFTHEQLGDIEVQTFKMFRWTMGFADTMNVLIFQMSAIPSLENLITQNDVDEIGAMADYRIKSAVHDNFMALYDRVRTGDLELAVGASDLASRLANTRYGISDRYQDFVIAERDEVGNVNQEIMRNFVYSMLGGVTEPDAYATRKMRSTQAIMARIDELGAIYATTDLPTDLRLAFMGLLGEYGLTDDLRYRAGSVLKPDPDLDPGTFEVRKWSTRMYNEAREAHEDFQSDYAAINTARSQRQAKLKTVNALVRTYKYDVPLFLKDALQRLMSGDVVMHREDMADEKLVEIVTELSDEIAALDVSIGELMVEFQNNHGVPFLAPRGSEKLLSLE